MGKTLRAENMNARQRGNTPEGEEVISLNEARAVKPAHVRAGLGQIEWSLDTDEEGDEIWQSTKFDPECLFDFMRLATSNASNDFVRFTQTYGVLGLTRSGLPSATEHKNPPVVDRDPTWFYEPLILWKAYAQSAKAIVALTLALRGDRPIDAAEVLASAGLTSEVLVSQGEISEAVRLLDPKESGRALWSLTHFSFQGEPTLEAQRSWVASMVQRAWIDRANIVPVLEWRGNPARFAPAVPSRERTSGFRMHHSDAIWQRQNMAFTMVAAGLVDVVCTDRNVAPCSRCGEFHPLQRRARTDQPHYCENCRIEVHREASRLAARERYARQKAERVQSQRN